MTAILYLLYFLLTYSRHCIALLDIYNAPTYFLCSFVVVFLYPPAAAHPKIEEAVLLIVVSFVLVVVVSVLRCHIHVHHCSLIAAGVECRFAGFLV